MGEGLSFQQCEHVIAKLMQREDQLEYLFHEWSGVFPTLPSNARRALSKGLLPAVGRCPHVALDFVLKELEASPTPPGQPRGGVGLLSAAAMAAPLWRLMVGIAKQPGKIVWRLLGPGSGAGGWN